MQKIPVVVIGAGHAGLAMSHRLTQRSLEHVVLERTRVASSWSARWPSLRLLTPNWQSRLPGVPAPDRDPHGFASAADVAHLIGDYARAIAAPVVTGVDVSRLGRAGSGYRIDTPVGAWACDAVVLATGAANRASVPAAARAVPPGITQLTPLEYRRPDLLPEGGVLVVGASATGVQLADDVARAGRRVTLAVGEHVRMPRSYRGRDIFWWMDASGVLDERHDELEDIVRARHVPSPQLVGSDDGRMLDLNALVGGGVRLVGKLMGIADGAAQFSGSLANVCHLADLKMHRLLDTFDEWAAAAAPGNTDDLGPPERFEPTRPTDQPTLSLRLDTGEIGSIIWATGFSPDYSWLDLDVLDRKGKLMHDGGVVRHAPGVYAMGLPVMRRRRSTFISGAAADSHELAYHLHRHLDRTTHRFGAHAG
jgi:putative flavoprotein involved in K+ transport